MIYFLIILLTMTGASSSRASELGSFDQELTRFLTVKKCKDSKTIAAQYGLGRLYGCILGKAETAKYFINENPNTGKVKNVKIMWNDWFVDIGYGLHADKSEAEDLVNAAARLYGPKLKQKLLSMMRQSNDKMIEYNGIVFSYTFSRGPKINERLITISPK